MQRNLEPTEPPKKRSLRSQQIIAREIVPKQ